MNGLKNLIVRKNNNSFVEIKIRTMEIKIINKSPFEAPAYATLDSAGFDLRANTDMYYTLKPLERALFKTGIFIEIPKGYVGYVCTRSGLAIKKGLVVLNAPGVVDSDYRQEIGVILINLSNEDVSVLPGDRIAQMIISTYEKVKFNLVKDIKELSSTDRSGGFGSTGVA